MCLPADATKFAVVRDPVTGTWVYDAGGPVGGDVGGINFIELSDVGGTAHILIEGNCADGTPWSAEFDLADGSNTCSPLHLLGNDVIAGGSITDCGNCQTFQAITAVVTE
jgi:hypothetical protein